MWQISAPCRFWQYSNIYLVSRIVRLKVIQPRPMKATNSNFTSDEIPIPVPGRGEALVRVHCFGITQSDVRLKDVLPVGQLGVEFSGRIETFGSGDKGGFRTGQSVYGLAISGGAFAEYVTCPLHTLCPIPAGVSFAHAASLAEMWFGALQVLKHDAELKKRDKILVYNALSSIGQSTVQVAQLLGCRRVFAVVSTRAALAALEKHLVFRTALPDEVVPLLDTPRIETEVARFGDDGLAAVIDLRQKSDPAQGIRLLRGDGRLAISGVAPALTGKDLKAVVYKRLRLHGVTLRAREPQFYKEYRDFIVEHLNPKFSNGQLKIRLVHVYEWKDMKTAFDLVAHNPEMPGKVVCSIVRD